MIRHRYFWVTLLLCLFASCMANSNYQQQATGKKNPTLLGANRDDHGCIPSAGYVWSKLLNNCIRVWEKGSILQQYNDSVSTYRKAVYIVCNADSSLIEVFGMTDTTFLIERETTSNLWKLDHPTIVIQKKENGFVYLPIESTP